VDGVRTGLGLLIGVLEGPGGIAADPLPYRGALHRRAMALTILIAIGVPAVVGLASGSYPARRAARLSPIDALRHERHDTRERPCR
jgi:ABC-type antimicrobial peptide transport system permease subunit